MSTQDTNGLRDEVLSKVSPSLVDLSRVPVGTTLHLHLVTSLFTWTSNVSSSGLSSHDVSLRLFDVSAGVVHKSRDSSYTNIPLMDVGPLLSEFVFLSFTGLEWHGPCHRTGPGLSVSPFGVLGTRKHFLGSSRNGVITPFNWYMIYDETRTYCFHFLCFSSLIFVRLVYGLVSSSYKNL